MICRNDALETADRPGRTRNPSTPHRQGATPPAEPGSPFLWQLSEPLAEHSRDQVLLRGLHPTEMGRVARSQDPALEATDDPNVHTLVFCTEGAARIEAADASFDIEAGQASILPAGTPYRVTDRHQGRLSLAWLRFSGEDSDYYVRTLGHGLSRIALTEPAAARVQDVLGQLRAVLEENSTEWHMIHAAHLARLLMSHLLGQKVTHFQGSDEPLHPGVTAAVQYMQHNLDLSLALKDIARQAGLSVSHFCALFRTQMGVTPMEYLTRLKLQKARRLLVSTALTVQEIAQQVGYEDRYYFSRLFRKLNGVPPITYRRQQRDQAHAAMAC